MTVLGLQHMLDAVEKRSPLQCPSVNYRILAGQDEIILYLMSYNWFNEAVWCWDCKPLQSCMMWRLLNNELGRTWKQVVRVSFETSIDCNVVRSLWRHPQDVRCLTRNWNLQNATKSEARSLEPTWLNTESSALAFYSSNSHSRGLG